MLQISIGLILVALIISIGQSLTGGFISKAQAAELMEKQIRFEPFQMIGAFHLMELPGMFNYWAIGELGRVSRWSKLHRKISQEYKKHLSQKLKQ